MDRSPLVVIGDPDEDPAPTPPPGRRPLGFIAALVAAGAVWALVANSPQLEPALLEEEAPAPFPTTTVYRSALETGGGEVLLPGSGVITDIAGGLAVAVDQWYWAGSHLWRISDDNWTYLPSPDLAGAEINGLAQLPSGRYVAAGVRWETGDTGSPVVFISDDEGQSWSEVSGFPERGGAHYADFFGGQLVLLGWEGAGAARGSFPSGGTNHTSPRLWISADGLTWTSAEVEAPTTGRFEQVIERDGVMVLAGSMGSQARLWTSTNLGLSWHLIEGEEASWPVRWHFVSVAAQPGGGFVALSSSLDSPDGQTFLWRSSDLQRWTRDEDPSPRGAHWIQWGPNGDFLAGSRFPRMWVDQPGTVLFTSADGHSWEPVEAFPEWDLANGATNIDGRLAVFGGALGQPRAWTWPHQSVDVELPGPSTGVWTVRFAEHAADFSWQVVRAGNGFIIHASDGWYWSDDATLWAEVQFDGEVPDWIGNVSVTAAGMLMIGGSDDGGQRLWWSSDGSRWSPTSVTAAPEGWLAGVYELAGEVVAAVRGGNEIRLWSSTDGMGWTPREPSWPGFDSVIQTGTSLVGMSWPYSAVEIFRSTDGNSWEEIEGLGRLSYLVDTPVGLVAVDHRSAMTLLDHDLNEVAEIVPPVQTEDYEIVRMGDGLAIRGWSDSVLYYTNDLIDWQPLPLTVEAGMTAAYGSVVGGPGFFVAGYDRGEVKLWQWVP